MAENNLQKLKRQMEEQERDIGLKARLQTNPIGRTLLEIGDLLEAQYDMHTSDTDEELAFNKEKRDSRFNILRTSDTGKYEDNFQYNPQTGEVENVALVDREFNPSEMDMILRDQIEKGKEDSNGNLYSIGIDGGEGPNMSKIGIAAGDFDFRHSLSKWDNPEEAEVHALKKPGMMEALIKADQTAKGNRAYGKGAKKEENVTKDFDETGLDGGHTEVFINNEKKNLVSAEVLDMAENTSDETAKQLLKIKAEKLAGEEKSDLKETNDILYLKKIQEKFKLENEKHNFFSPKGGGNFIDTIMNDEKLFKEYEIAFNRESMTEKLSDNPTKKLQAMRIASFMSEKNNQIQEELEDLKLSKNDAAKMLALKSIYRDSDANLNSVMDGVANMASDPANLAGGKIFQGFQKLGKAIFGGSKKAAIVTGAAGVGGAYGGTSNAATQQTEKHAGLKDEIDLKELAISTGAGASLGVLLAGGGIVLNEKLFKKLNNVEYNKDTNTDSVISSIKQEAKEAIKENPSEKKAILADAKSLISKIEKNDKKKVEVRKTAKPEEVKTEYKPETVIKEETKKTPEKEVLTKKEEPKETTEKSEIEQAHEAEPIMHDKESIVNTDTEHRAFMAKEFIQQKKRVQKEGDTSSTVNELGVNSPIVIQKSGRSSTQSAGDKANRTVNQTVPVGKTPKESVDNVMAGYDRAVTSSSNRAEDAIGAQTKRWEHKVLAIEGMEAHYKEKGIKGEFAVLNGEKDKLLRLIEKNEKEGLNLKADFEAKVKIGKEKAQSEDNDLFFSQLEQHFKDSKVPEEMIKPVVELLSKVNDFEKGRDLTRYTEKTGLAEIPKKLSDKKSKVKQEIEKMFNNKDILGEKGYGALREKFPAIVKNILGGAHSKAEKRMFSDLVKDFDNIVGTNRKPAKKIKKKKEEIEAEAGNDITKPLSEKVAKQWKDFDRGKENIYKDKGVTAAKQREESDDDSIKRTIYKILANDKLPIEDRKYLEDALLHTDSQSDYMSPLELTEQKLQNYQKVKNRRKSVREFGEDMIADDIAIIKSNRKLNDASSQVVQIIGALDGNIDMFDAIGAIKKIDSPDYRNKIAEELAGDGLLKGTADEIREIVKVITRNLAYTQQKNSAVTEIIKASKGMSVKDAEHAYDIILNKLLDSSASGLVKYSDTMLRLANEGKIKTKFTMTLPNGRKIKIDARDTEKVNYKLFGQKLTLKKKVEVARPGKAAANAVQALDNYLKERAVAKVTGYDGIFVHDGVAFKNQKQFDEFLKEYVEGLKEINESGYLNKMLEDITGIPHDIPIQKIDFNKIDKNKLFKTEFEKGVVPTHEIRTNTDLVPDRPMDSEEILINILNKNDPRGKLGRPAIKQSVADYYSKNPKLRGKESTEITPLDYFVNKVAEAKTVDDLNQLARDESISRIKAFDIKDKAKVLETHKNMINMIRAELESKKDFTGTPIMEKSTILSDYHKEYLNQLAKLKDEGAEVAPISKKVENVLNDIKDDNTPKDIGKLEPKEMETVIDIVKKVDESKRDDMPTTKQETQKIVESTGGKTAEVKVGMFQKSEGYKKAYKTIREILARRKIDMSDVQKALEPIRKDLTKQLRKLKISSKEFKESFLDTGFRHIRNFTEETAKEYKRANQKTYDMYKKEIQQKAKGHTNPNERYGHYHNSMLALVRKRESLSEQASLDRASVLLKLSAIENMTPSKWKITQDDKNLKFFENAMETLDFWDKSSRTKLFAENPEHYNDSYLATLRESELLERTEGAISADTNKHVLGIEVSDKSPLYGEYSKAKNKRDFLQENKLVYKNKKLRQILVDKKAQKQFEEANPIDIIMKTSETTMRKLIEKDPKQNVMKLIESDDVFSATPKKGFRQLEENEYKSLLNKTGLDKEAFSKQYVNKILANQMFGTEYNKKLQGKVGKALSKMTQDFKYYAVPINPNSIINGLGWSIASVVGRHPIKGIPAIFKAIYHMRGYAKLDDAVGKAIRAQDGKAFTKAVRLRAKHPMFKAIEEGMVINAIDGVNRGNSMLHKPAERLFGKETKKLRVMKNLFLRPGSTMGEGLLNSFSYVDTIGRYASYTLIKGSKHEDGYGAGVLSNKTFGDMSHNSNSFIESADTIPLFAFSKWGERTVKEILTLPATQQATLLASGLLINKYARENDIEDKGFNPLATVLEATDDFIIAPFMDNYDKYSSEDSLDQKFTRGVSNFVLPSVQRKLILAWLYDDRVDGVQKKMLKLILTPQGTDFQNLENGYKYSADGEKIPLINADTRSWMRQVFEPSKKTKEQYEAGKWRSELYEEIFGKEQVDSWKKENRLNKKELRQAMEPAYSPIFGKQSSSKALYGHK